MADSVFDMLSSADQIKANYSNYADKFKDSTKELVNSETFLSLLVAEMTNQDPLEPTSNTEFITQMAQFTQLQYSQDASTYSMANYASSLVGKNATGTKMDGGNLVTKTGTVESVTKNGDKYTVTIDGTAFDLSAVSAISAANSSGITTGGALGDQISRASMMVGMQATVSVDKDGTPFVDSGIISAIQVKNGEISAVINGLSYKLSDIVEVKYATVDAPDESTDPSDNTDQTDPTDKVDETAPAENETDDLEDVVDDMLDEMIEDIIDSLDDEEDDITDPTEELEPEIYEEDLQDITREEL